MSNHFIENCLKCKKVTGQCRCPDKNKLQQWTICPKCAKLCEAQ